MKNNYSQSIHDKDYDEFIQDIELLIRNVNSVIKRRGREILQDFNITPPQFIALQSLTKEGDLTIGELSDRLFLACSTVTDLVDRMEKNELVKRYRDDKDRRIVRIKVLEKGHKLISEVIAARQEYLKNILKDLSKSERERIIFALTQLNELMNH
ncbi:MarR family winged helix-turn-helix transcriptional regulator [Natranaerobius thermophilus]|uniref:Transcriptional regulator n=1 Tax=Natranaerobius thermophilus (strain ATCC BAA-1301 / DSM 18059 / JW/NM-WN-LF) TaxID=457570 RepID=B2A6J3_NATTJ|nr:MarR family transcriptional regulator [Natranaerobius thermophilus]ACB85526.1 transcriptional regulator [Natranaerobius thermophilus JW/NM-WN-LF]